MLALLASAQLLCWRADALSKTIGTIVSAVFDLLTGPRDSPPAGNLGPPHAGPNAQLVSSECLLNRLAAGSGCTRLPHAARIDVVACRSAHAAHIVRSEHIVPRHTVGTISQFDIV